MNEIDSSVIKILWATRKSLVMAVMLGLGALVLISAVVIPQAQQSYDLYNDLQKEKPKLEKLDQKLAEIESVQVSPEFAQVQVVEEALPSRKPLLELMMSLNNVGQETGAVVTDFELSPGLVATDSTQLETRQTGNYDELSLDLTIQGTFAQIQDFLLKVEEVAPFTTIVSMEIGNQINTNAQQFEQQITDNPTFEAILTTETYFFTQSINARIDSPLPKIAKRELDVLGYLSSFRPSSLEDQIEVQGGGLQDLFQINPESGEIELVPQEPTTTTQTPVEPTTTTEEPTAL